MNTDQFNHAPADLFMYTGSPRNGGASLGSWITYGLGTENQDLPGFVVLLSGGSDPTGGKACWGSGFLPGVFQGVQCRATGDPILYASNPAGMSRESRRRTLDVPVRRQLLVARSKIAPRPFIDELRFDREPAVFVVETPELALGTVAHAYHLVPGTCGQEREAEQGDPAPPPRPTPLGFGAQRAASMRHKKSRVTAPTSRKPT